MAFRSAAVVVREFDFSQFSVQLGLATLAVMGGASKGPMNTPTKCTSTQQLKAGFGPTLLNDHALAAAVRFLNKGNQLIFSRIGNGQATADIPIAGLTGGTPAVKATATIAFNSATNPTDGETVTLRVGIPTVRIDNTAVGALGNVAITKSGSTLKVTGMTGGTVSTVASGFVSLIGSVNPTTADTVTVSDGTTAKIFEFTNTTPGGGHIAVAIGGDGYATLANLVTALNGAGFNCVATDVHVEKVFEFDNNSSFGGGHVGVTIGLTAAATELNLIGAINNQVGVLGMNAVDSTSTVPQLTITQGVGGLVGNALLAKSAANITITGFTGGVDLVPGSSTTVLAIEAASPGSWGNTIQVMIAATTTLGAPGGNFDLFVLAPVDQSGTLQVVERFNNLSLDNSVPSTYIETVLSLGLAGQYSPSQYVRADVLVNDGSPGAGTYALGTGSGVVGLDGIDGLVDADYVGAITGQTATGLMALANPERVVYNILAVPGITHVAVVTAAIAMVEKRGDAIYVIDPPFGLTISQVIDWHNGVSNLVPNPLTQPLNSSYAAVYWPWVQDYDEDNAVNVWMPPSGFVAGAYSYTDQVAGPWFVPAGHSRGPIDGIALEYSPDQDERDLLNSGNNVINPIVAFPDGLKLFGNRTTQRAQTDLCDIHVRRMLLYAEALVANSVKFLVFDPNDALTWRRFELLVNPILSNIQANRGLAAFFVSCNSDTNPTAQQQQGVMRGQIGIQAIPDAEIIYTDFALFATGAQFTTNF